jgi:hypothetical protein
MDIVEDKKLYTMLSKNARTSSKMMSEAKMTREWMNLFKKVVERYKKEHHTLGRKKGLARDMFDKTLHRIMRPFEKYKKLLFRIKP